jgi:hypothetical protein
MQKRMEAMQKQLAEMPPEQRRMFEQQMKNMHQGPPLGGLRP